ncbi:hypothetical protein J2T17_007018 [Paenibacillus mucilaginosus]|uniref:glycoside hydrolase family 26 protein n=1 Tax=Paenibacillus mucilaginosus TaxID=61624 RepID=UPI003D1E6B9F
MNNKARRTGFSVLLALLLLLGLWALFRMVPPAGGPPDGERLAAPAPVLPLTEYWQGQAEAAEKAGHAEAAANYRARLEARDALLASGPSAPPEIPEAADADLRLYLRTARSAAPDPGLPAKFEPVSGTYLGMLGADSRVRYDITKVEQVYGRRHALYLSYVGWRKLQTDTNTYFPKRTADRVRALDGALQIGWEPRYGLQDVLDDEYVRRFAREAKELGIPIFLRYASEMNGAWVPWHGDPALYVEKFRLIHDIMEEEAPNVAMVWSPNFSPAEGIDAYYPGDEYVDWVGFSLYSTPVTNGQEDLKDNVIEAFAPLYAEYSHKPIMISEGAVAHSVISTGRSYYEWAEEQLGYMYTYLPVMFPQVKAITYFNFSRAQAGRSNMDFVYDLGENPYTDGGYRRLAASPRFLGRIDTAADPVDFAYKLHEEAPLPEGRQTVSVYAKLPDGSAPFAAALYHGEERLGISFEMPWEMEVELPAGAAEQPLRIVVYDKNGKPAALRTLLAGKG